MGERLKGCVFFSVLFYNSIRDRQVNCWLELVVASVRPFVGGCDRDSLLVQPHHVCDTLRRALSCPTLGNYTHFTSTSKAAGILQSKNRAQVQEWSQDI